jgi:uncharacterized protein (DUF1330 family)
MGAEDTDPGGQLSAQVCFARERRGQIRLHGPGRAVGHLSKATGRAMPAGVRSGPMAAYLIAEISVTDVDGYEEYKRLAEASVSAYGGSYIVRGGEVDSLEGDAVEGRVIVLEFPDLHTARRWYRSDEYQAALPLRTATARSRLFFVAGHTP